LSDGSERRERILGEFNATAGMNNEPVFTALEETTGCFHQRNAAAWWEWWEKYNEVHDQLFPSKPTVYAFHRTTSTYDTVIHKSVPTGA
jgi:hypothetical protein